MFLSTQNKNGDPWKILKQLSSQIWKSRIKNSGIKFQKWKHVYVHAQCTLCMQHCSMHGAHRVCTGLHGPKYNVRDVFFSKTLFWNFKSCPYPNLRTFLKNIFFHPRVPPLCFEPFWTICPARFRKWQGVNLKIGISSFHRSFSFCYKQIA